jgi:hypothetical protein
MDAMSWWTLGISVALCVVLIIWIIHFMVVELRREKQLDKH